MWSMSARVFLYVQHLLGIGHLKRAATLAGALTSAGMEVTVASGGVPVPGLTFDVARLVQLPPASVADLSFKSLIDEQGRPVDEAWKARRRDLLLQAWRETQADGLLVELFPFGRRQMRFELLPLLEEARAAGAPAANPPVIACSVRDVLGGGQKNPARQDEMLNLFERYFDHLLVHGDPALIPFDRTFRHAARLADRLHYTGYIVAPAQDAGSAAICGDASSAAGSGEVIVSAGGGAVGRGLLEAAILARPSTRFAHHHWRLLAGVNMTSEDFNALAQRAREQGAGRITVERARADFTTLLANCALSISQGGYNTLMEILQAGVPAVVVPFAGGAEIEQSLRSRLLEERGMIAVVEEAALTPELLAAAVNRCAGRPAARHDAGGIDVGGARRSAELLSQWMAARCAPA
jgi:predicted glycosyltransferase